jgi:hypothetical protein
VRALHRLCHWLNEAGYEAYVETTTVHPDWHERVADEAIQRELARDGIVVYPEVEEGNKLGARRVARFILNIPGLIRGSGVFDGSELLFGYCRLMRRYLPDDRNILTVPVVDQGVFRVDRERRRAGGVYWVGKGADGPGPEVEWMTEITLDWPASWDALADLFRGRTIFVSYANYTQLLVEARLCGCPAAVIPNGRYNRFELLFDTPGGIYGLAWGLAAHEIAHACRSVEFYPDAYRTKVVEAFPAQLHRFIQLTQAM